MKQSGVINPLIVNADYQLLAGEGRYRALRKIGVRTACVVVVRHLNEEEQRSYSIADNRLAEKSSWDLPALAAELREIEIAAPMLDLTLTGFGHAKIEQLVTSLDQQSWSDLDQPVEPVEGTDASTRPGDIFEFPGGHRLICGDSTDPNTVSTLMGGEKARLVAADAPFNRASKTFSGKGRNKHSDFAMAFGEMSPPQFTTFLAAFFAAIMPFLADGTLLYMFMDWLHLHELLDAGREQHLELKNILVWDKGKGGMGSLYRSGHELIALFKHGSGSHVNNIELGKNGRDRSNVLRYAGMNSFGGGRDKALAMHPTVKPVQLISDLLLDTSHRGDIVYDGFGGSGTTLIAAHKMGRRARLVELSPTYCDTIVERFIRAFGEEPTLAATGQPYREMRDQRLAERTRGTSDAK